MPQRTDLKKLNKRIITQWDQDYKSAINWRILVEFTVFDRYFCVVYKKCFGFNF